MSTENKANNSTESQASGQTLTDEALDQVSGGSQDGSDLLIVNNGDGSDFLESQDQRDLTGEPASTDSASSDPEWKYVNVRR